MSKQTTFRAWIGFCDDKPFNGFTTDTYRNGTPFDAVTIFKSRSEARYRFQDVRRCVVTIKPVAQKKRQVDRAPPIPVQSLRAGIGEGNP